MTYINLTRAEIELLAHCRSLTLWDASGEHTLDEGSSAWNGLVGAACDSADLLGVIREQRAEIERLTRERDECRKLLRKIIEKQEHNHTWLGTAAGQEWLDRAREAGGE